MQVPEMLRVPLDGLILQIKLLGLGEPSDFLGMLVQKYLLDWYKSTCFTSTNAQTLTRAKELFCPLQLACCSWGDEAAGRARMLQLAEQRC